MINANVGDRIAFRLLDGSGVKHEGTVTALFEDPRDGLYVSTPHIADLSLTVDEVTRVIAPAGAP